jgi:triacylglycerol esterase/lipase EstA (alpha/beta hydrolase family)
MMPAPAPERARRLLAHWAMTQPLLQAADLRGAAQLTTEAVAGLTHLVEAMHARIATPPLLGKTPPEERTRGVTGLVYRSIRGVTHVVGGSVEALLGWLGPALIDSDDSALPRPEREAIVAALNGVVGDHLAATGNPLAIAMGMRHGGRDLPLERFALRARLRDAGPRPLLLLHGLCMNDLQWQRAGHDHGAALAREAGFTPVYLHYNSGLSVSTNGRILAQQMERMFDAWPMPIERIALLGHSMGGLVARSALHHAALIARGALRWPGRVTDLVTLGTPHQGALLESAGHLVDVLLGATPYAAPLARIGQVRSAGINDLRHGSIVSGKDEDTTIALPDGVRCYAVAASLGADSDATKGDGLVSIASALGQHRQPARRLRFADDRQAVVARTGHLDLLSSPEVFGLLRSWLSAAS